MGIFGFSRKVTQSDKPSHKPATGVDPAEIEKEKDDQKRIIKNAKKEIDGAKKALEKYAVAVKENRKEWCKIKMAELLKRSKMSKQQAKDAAEREYDAMLTKFSSGYGWDMHSMYDSQFDPVFTGGYMAYKGNTGL